MLLIDSHYTDFLFYFNHNSSDGSNDKHSRAHASRASKHASAGKTMLNSNNNAKLLRTLHTLIHMYVHSCEQIGEWKGILKQLINNYKAKQLERARYALRDGRSTMESAVQHRKRWGYLRAQSRKQTLGERERRMEKDSQRERGVNLSEYCVEIINI